VAVTGNYAYVADEGSGLRIINVSNPATPTEVGFYDTPGWAQGVAVAGNYAYVADGGSGLRIINVSNPATPTEVGFYDSPGNAEGVAVVGNYAYVADRGGLRIINVSNPAAPTQVGFCNTPEDANDVAVAGNYAYVADWNGGLRIINVSNPAAPTQVGFYDTSSVWCAYGVAAAGNYAYVADCSHGLRIINVSNPVSPTEVGFYDTPGESFGVAVAGNYAYVADREGGLVILRFTGGGPIDLSVDSVSPVQVVEMSELDAQNRFLVKGKTTAVKVVISKTGGDAVDNVSVQLTNGSRTLNQFYVAEKDNTAPANNGLIFDNTFYHLNFDSGAQTKTVYFFSSDLIPIGNSYQVTATVDYPGDIFPEYNTKPSDSYPVYETRWDDWHDLNHPDLSIHYFPADWDRSVTELDSFIDYTNRFLRGVLPVAEERYESDRSLLNSLTTDYRMLLPPYNRLNKFELTSWMGSEYIGLRLSHRDHDRFVAVVPPGWFYTYTVDYTTTSVFVNRKVGHLMDEK
jgi:DNA-binding beta-propeller fold protein YncE